MVSLKEGMLDAVRTTLEEMFFLEVTVPQFKWARVRVEEPFTGAVTLAFPRPLLEDVASGLMPGEDEIPEQMLSDMLAELVNTVAGRLINSVVSDDTTFKLGIPETGTGWPEAQNIETTIHPFQIDRKCFIVQLEGATLAKAESGLE